MPWSNSKKIQEGQCRKIDLLPLAQDLCDSMADYCARLLNLFFGQSESNADLQPSWHDLLRLEVVF